MALIEVLVAMLILGVSTIAVTGLVVVGSKSAIESAHQTSSLGVMNNWGESVRAMRYNDVGYINPESGEPDGVLPRHLTFSESDQAMDIEVELVDDPANGTLPTGSLSEDTADYKKVSITVDWRAATGSGQGRREVASVLYITPQSSCAQQLTCVPGEAEACANPDNTYTTQGCGFTPAGGGSFVEFTEACPDSGVCPPPPPPPPTDDPPCPPGSVYCPTPTPSPTPCPAGTCCDGSTTCPSGEVCEEGACVPSCVTSPSQCGAGESCKSSTGVCEPDCTASTGECADGYFCDPADSVCVTPPPPEEPTDNPEPTPPTDCTSSSQCPAGESCVNDVCALPDATPGPDGSCTDSSQCGGGSCVDGTCSGDSCSSDSDCGSGLVCGSGGVCEGSWCTVEEAPGGCQTGVIFDPGCGCPGFDGRFVSSYVLAEASDPMCISVPPVCNVESEWVACGACPDEPETACDLDGDGLQNCGPSASDDNYVDAGSTQTCADLGRSSACCVTNCITPAPDVTPPPSTPAPTPASTPPLDCTDFGCPNGLQCNSGSGYCEGYCGNGSCADGEDSYSCEPDCGPPPPPGATPAPTSSAGTCATGCGDGYYCASSGQCIQEQPPGGVCYDNSTCSTGYCGPNGCANPPPTTVAPSQEPLDCQTLGCASGESCVGPSSPNCQFNCRTGYSCLPNCGLFSCVFTCTYDSQTESYYCPSG
ncbi:MAG: hypothetical protein HYZ63_02195 [Candidatus Andersenbacteria bacterium]|nr:hypothetical protein [Candidatus Andersenbacteria bacterium]